MTVSNSSFSTLYTAPTAPAPGKQTVVNPTVDPTINTTIASQPYNFLLGTTNWDGGAPINEGAAAVDPVTNGAPEYSLPGADTGLGPDGSTNPTDLDPSVFQAWTAQQQLLYLNNWGLADSTGQINVAIGTNVPGAQALFLDGPSDGSAPLTNALLGITNPSVTAAIVNQFTGDTSAATLSQALNAPGDLGANGAIAPASLDPSVFSAWSSEQQSEYLNFWLSNNSGSYSFNIGSAVGGGATPITAVLSQTSPGTVYIVNSLQASQIAEMSPTDLAVVSATAAFQQVALQLNLSTDTSTATNSIASEIADIEGTDSTTTTATTYFATEIYAPDQVVIPADQRLNRSSTLTGPSLSFKLFQIPTERQLQPRRRPRPTAQSPHPPIITP